MEYYNKGDIKVRDSVEKDIMALKDHLRQSDVDEIWASHRHTPEKALQLSFETSTLCLTAEVKGKPVAMFGVAPQTLLGDQANIWLLSSNGILKIRKTFLKECRKFIDLMLSDYPLLDNYVDARNKLSIRWLKWCGAKIAEAKNLGIDNRPFHYFSFRRETSCVHH